MTTSQGGGGLLGGRFSTERACALSWFVGWDPDQRAAFAGHLRQLAVHLADPQAEADALLHRLDSISLE